jgi:hypothetical protein
VPAQITGAGTEVDDVIGDTDRLLVMLDDDDGVAEIAQARERAEQLPVVALVQADRRLVEDVQHAGQVRTDLRREADALSFAARQRRRAAAQAEISDADVVQEGQTLLDFLQNPLGNDRLAIGQLQTVEHVHGFGNRQIDVVRDGSPLHLDRQALLLQPLAVAGGAGTQGPERVQL